VIFFESEVIHFGVASIAHAVDVFVGLRYHSTAQGADFADASGASLAVSDGVLAKTTGKKGITNLAVSSWFAFFFNGFEVKLDRKILKSLI